MSFILKSTLVAGGLAAGAVALAAPTAVAAPDSDWDRLAQCESGGNWQINTGNGYHGGLQFHPQTWIGHGGGEFAPTANQASREQQIVVAERVLASQGWGAWPACSSALGLNSAPTMRTAPQPQAPAPVPAEAPAPEQTGPAPLVVAGYEIPLTEIQVDLPPIPATTVIVPDTEAMIDWVEVGHVEPEQTHQLDIAGHPVDVTIPAHGASALIPFIELNPAG